MASLLVLLQAIWFELIFQIVVAVKLRKSADRSRHANGCETWVTRRWERTTVVHRG